jgi:hypothetical protein
MIATWVLDRIHCRWLRKWLTLGQWRALPHVSAAVLAFNCGPSTHIPPAYAVPPPAPPAQVWAPPAEWPPTGVPPAWGYTPPGGYVPFMPIPLGPVLEVPGGPRETGGSSAPSFEALAPASELSPPCPAAEGTPRGVPEPGGVAILGAALLGLGLARRRTPCARK